MRHRSSLVLPRGTPPQVVATLRNALRQAIREAPFRESIERLGFEPIDEDPEDFASVLKSEIDRYGLLIKEMGIRINVQ